MSAYWGSSSATSMRESLADDTVAGAGGAVETGVEAAVLSVNGIAVGVGVAPAPQAMLKNRDSDNPSAKMKPARSFAIPHASQLRLPIPGTREPPAGLKEHTVTLSPCQFLPLSSSLLRF